MIDIHSLQILYLANVFAGGALGLLLLNKPEVMCKVVFAKHFKGKDVYHMISSFFLAIAIVSLFAIERPYAFIPVILFQLVFLCLWIGRSVVPMLVKGDTKKIPWGFMIGAFLWVSGAVLILIG